MTTFAVLFAEAQAARRLSDNRLARQLGVSQPTVTRWRSGAALPSEQHIPMLAKFLHRTQRDLRAILTRDQIAAQRRAPKPAEGSLAQMVRELENTLNLTPLELAARVGIDRSTYYRYRRDESTPALEDIPTLAPRFGVSEDTLLHAVYRTRTAR